MKKIVLIRHAKAVPYGYEDDFGRNLTDRGREDAALIGVQLFSDDIIPDLIISSPATRAISTARIIAEKTSYNNRIVENPDIYEGMTTSEMIELIQQTEKNVNTLFFFGHNPGFDFYANSLQSEKLIKMPTCSTVIIKFEVENWQSVEARNGKFVHQYTPKELK
jgi:phosphohistidine phosphatase